MISPVVVLSRRGSSGAQDAERPPHGQEKYPENLHGLARTTSRVPAGSPILPFQGRISPFFPRDPHARPSPARPSADAADCPDLGHRLRRPASAHGRDRPLPLFRPALRPRRPGAAAAAAVSPERQPVAATGQPQPAARRTAA